MGNHVTKEFSTLGDFVHFAGLRLSPWGDNSRSVEENPSWGGTRTFPEAVNLALYGWPEGRENMSKELDDMKAKAAKADLPTWTHDVAGFLPDVPRAVAGVPDCMYSPGDYSHKSKPVIKIIANLGKRACINGESAVFYGAGILTWVDRLEALGFSCELTAYLGTKMRGDKGDIFVILKEAGQVLDIDRLAFCLANPAFHRRLKFAVIENIPELSSSHADNYGAPQNLTTEAREKLNPTVYVPLLSHNPGQMEAFRMVSDAFREGLTAAGVTLPIEENA